MTSQPERNRMKTHCLRGHAFDEENTKNYKGHRQCRACARQREAEARQAEAEEPFDPRMNLDGIPCGLPGYYCPCESCRARRARRRAS